MKNKSTKNEIYIFKKFAKLSRYSINLNSIIKKELPEPDISCSLSEGSIIAFELVEIIDEDLARSFNDFNILKEALKQRSQKREEFEVKFNNALIEVAFTEKIPLHRKKNSILKILDYLITLDKTSEGIFRPKDLIYTIKYTLISGGEFIGPIIDVTSFAWIDDPCKERIKRKFEKEYETESNNIELLSYY